MKLVQENKDLFGQSYKTYLKTTKGIKRKSNFEYNKMDLLKNIELENYYGLPIIQPIYSPLPHHLIPFNQAIASHDYLATIHFYIDDYQVNRVLNNIHKYIPLFSRYASIVGFDFSQFADMPFAQRLSNQYYNRLLSAFLQRQGVKVYPNITWSLPDSYQSSFSGMPKRSIIAINSNGIKGNAISQKLWLSGYYKAIETLEPTKIIRYGELI